MFSVSTSIVALSFVIIWAASFLFAMLGLGGGMVYVPVMKWLGFDLKSVAIPLGLLLNGLNTALAMIPYHKAKLIDYKGALPFALAAIIGAPFGAYTVQFIPTRIVLILFITAVLIAAFRVFVSTKAPDEDNLIEFKKRLIYGGISGLLIGFVGGMLGIGGGFLAAPILMSMGYNAKRAAATTAYIVTFSSASGFLGHVAEGHFDPLLTAVLVVAVLLGSQLGARFTVKKAKSKTIKKIYVIILLLIAIKLTLGLFGVRFR
ncbi:sulfite exporter TauE/SafE family protein [Hippea alviniae]|uniref:sulfite exporter TauE/SafE family protein n=1 Tax=Hippea alviniae TaxID=1279027 RepID=UPI0003B39B99|nr:sulfite exporter TauE/SafE family protein [Hippea alviniae]